MIFLIGQHHIATADERPDRPAVGGEAGREHQCRFGAQEFGQAAVQLFDATANTRSPADWLPRPAFFGGGFLRGGGQAADRRPGPSNRSSRN